MEEAPRGLVPREAPARPRWHRRLLELDYGAIDPAKRGFSMANPRCVERIRGIGAAFLDGYHAALRTTGVDDLVAELEAVPADLSGFAFEGAAMGVALLDWLEPWRRDRFPVMLGHPVTGGQHVYMLHVGMGWAYTRLPGSPERATKGNDPLLSWLAVDGFGFHEGFFRHARVLRAPRHPRGLSPFGRQVFDQGLGRSLWFVFGGDADAIARAIQRFEPGRHADLWSGVGLACIYAGGCDAGAIDRLADLAGRYRPELAQGASFGAKARHRAGILNEHAEAACRVLCGSTAADAATLTDTVLATVDPTGGGTSYAAWRRGIADHYKEILRDARDD